MAHRNSGHFPGLDVFKPSRWLAAQSDSDIDYADGNGGTVAMKKLYVQFSKGICKCLGQITAMVSLRIIVATLVLKYDVKLAEGAKLADMDWDVSWI